MKKNILCHVKFVVLTTKTKTFKNYDNFIITWQFLILQ